jgi:hypothetical protein
MSKYAELRTIDVSKLVEKKNNLTYLSWAWAVDQLLLNDPAAVWEYPEPKLWGETVMIFCTVSAFGISRTAQLPVMDYRNQPIPNPNSFQVNTAMQRCLAKAIALHGIGLYIYNGEDLPPSDPQAVSNPLDALPAAPVETVEPVVIVEHTDEPWNLMVPTMKLPYSTWPSALEWVVAFDDLQDVTVKATKRKASERMKILRELKESNAATLDRMGEALRLPLLARYQQRLTNLAPEAIKHGQ